MKDKKAAKLIIKRAKKNPELYSEEEVRYAKEFRRSLKKEKKERYIIMAKKTGTDLVPYKAPKKYGRNEKVTISKNKETKVLKYKKAKTLLKQGWKVSDIQINTYD